MAYINKIYITKYNLILKVDMSDKTTEWGQLWVCVCLYTDTPIQHVSPGLYFSSLFEVVSPGTLWDCGCVSPTQTHTLAPKEQGITEKKEEWLVKP